MVLSIRLRSVVIGFFSDLLLNGFASGLKLLLSLAPLLKFLSRILSLVCTLKYAFYRWPGDCDRANIIMSDLQKQIASERTHLDNSSYFYEVENPCSSDEETGQVTDTSTCIIIKQNPQMRDIVQFKQTFGPPVVETPKNYVNWLQLSIDTHKLRKLIKQHQEKIEQMQIKQQKHDLIALLTKQKANSLRRLYLTRKQLNHTTNQLLDMQNKQQPEELQQEIDSHRKRIIKITNQIKTLRNQRERQVVLPSLKQQLRCATHQHHKLMEKHEQTHQKLKQFALRLVQADSRLESMMKIAKRQQLMVSWNPCVAIVDEKYKKLESKREQLKKHISISKMSLHTKLERLRLEISHQNKIMKDIQNKMKKYSTRSKSLGVYMEKLLNGPKERAKTLNKNTIL